MSQTDGLDHVRSQSLHLVALPLMVREAVGTNKSSVTQCDDNNNLHVFITFLSYVEVSGIG